jgi:uracil-DNA glycosylase
MLRFPNASSSRTQYFGIRETKGKSGPQPHAWVDDSLPFMTRLLKIIQPRAVVSLGTTAYRACRIAMHGRDREARIPMDAALTHVRQLNPFLRDGKPDWFAFYHCGLDWQTAPENFNCRIGSNSVNGCA